jgi:hypothetical protein
MRSSEVGGFLALGLALVGCSDGAGGGWAGAGGSGTAGAFAGGQLPGTAAGASGGAAAPPSFELLFDSAQLPSFYLTIPDASWQQLADCDGGELASDTPPPECDYQPATFHAEYDEAPQDGVEQRMESDEIPIGVRLKGRASFQPIDGKPAFKIKFTELAGERFLGLSRLTLNNMVQDPSSLRERIAYRVYRDAGLAAPLANSARVYVQRGEGAGYEYFGLYANVQTLDRRFVEQAFGEVGGAAGNLYDTKNSIYFTDFDRSRGRDQAGPEPGMQEQRFALETNDSMPDTSDLTAAIDAIYVEDVEAAAGALLATASPVIDVDQWLRVSAAQALIADWDGFAGARNNYKAYRDLVSGKFVILPWGTDQTFGYTSRGYSPNWHYALEHDTSDRQRPLFLMRCLADSADCANRYARIVAEVAASFDAQALLAEVDRAEQQITAAVLEDERRPEDDQAFRRGVQYVRHFIEHRIGCVGRLTSHQACEPLSCPIGDAPDCESRAR